MKTFTNHKAALLKYIMLSIFVYFAASGQQAGCGGSVDPPPPDPEFTINYNFTDESHAKIFFTPDQSVVLKKISVYEYSSGLTDIMEFTYPFLVCHYQQNHFINQYLVHTKGQKWDFTFTGYSTSIAREFSVTTTINIY